MERKLTVILSADVVGYSGLMERDEAGTLSWLKESRSKNFDSRYKAMTVSAELRSAHTTDENA